MSLARKLKRKNKGERVKAHLPCLDSSGLIEITDCDESQTLLFRPATFFQIENFPGNFQSWFSIARGEGESDRDFSLRVFAIRLALLQRIGRRYEPSEMDGCMFMPGSLNFSEKARLPDGSAPLVRDVYANKGFSVTQAELERTGLIPAGCRIHIRPPVTSDEVIATLTPLTSEKIQ